MGESPDRVLLSGVNFREISQTGSLETRAELVEAAISVVGNTRLIPDPGDVLKLALRAACAGEQEYVVSIPMVAKELRRLLDPRNAEIGEGLAETRDQTQRHEETTIECHARARPVAQEHRARQDHVDAGGFFFANRLYRSLIDPEPDDSSLAKLVANALGHAGTPRDRSLALELSEWHCFLMSFAVMIFDQTCREQGFKRVQGKKRAGCFDMLQGVYLALCDVLVTRDWGMYRHLLRVSRLIRTAYPGDRCGTVLYYEEFLSRLVDQEA